MADSESLPFKADYAKSARASCKQCSNIISKDVLRIATVTQSTRFDGKMVKWFHYACFFERNRPKKVLDIEGFNELRWEDQEKIKKKLGDSGDGSTVVTKLSDFLVEYASTGKASCRACETKLEKGELRISILAQDDRYGMVKKWHHPKCFQEKMEDLGFTHDIQKVAGFSSLSTEDKSKLVSLLKVKKSRKKPGSDLCGDGEQLPKKPKVEDNKLNDELAKQNKTIWKLIDKLKNVEKKEVRLFVEENVSSMPRGDSDLFQCAADILLFGALPPCPECKGQIFAKSDAYHCSGNVSAYTSCLYTAKELERKPFKVPEELANDTSSVFHSVKYTPKARVFPEVAAVKAQTVFENNNHLSEKDQLKRDKKWKSELKSMKVKVKGGAAVDPQSGLEDKHHVLMCDDSKPQQPYSAILNLVDIARGTNSYYKLQLLESDEGMKKVYHVFRAWGRLGTTIGDDKLEQFLSKSNAIANFEEVYLDKTGNHWEDRKNFVKMPSKFAPVEVDYEDGGNCDEKQDFDKGESKLAEPLQRLIKLIANFENLKRDMLEYEIDMEKMPLGRLSKKQIHEGYKILGEALQYVDINDKDANKMKILDVSNRFFTVIPHDFGMRRAPLLDNNDIINEKCKMLDNLSEIESAYKILSAVSNEEGETKSVMDSYYEQLKCKIEPVDRNSEEFKYIEQYVKNTHAPTHSHYTLEIQDLFQVKRKEELVKFTPFNSWPERKLLWHGSRLSNFASILSKGLKIAPPEAPVTGYMFGKGVYFADMVSKSANYCHAAPGNDEGLLLLCEVALGKSHLLTSANSSIKKPPTSHYSVHGLGKTCPDPAGFKTLKSGCVIPCGKPIESDVKKTDLLYNEFIVYDTAQIKMQYLVRVKFNFSIADLI